MKNVRIISLAIFCVVIAPLGDLLAKCAARPYKIAGVVIDESTKKGIAGAKLFFFFDNYYTTWSNGYQTSYPDFFETDDTGEFKASAWFETFKSYNAFTGHNCKGRPDELTIIVTVSGYLTKRVLLGKKELSIKEQTNEGLIHLAAIELEKSQ